jgi:nicotinate-nucleotide adenylyltransferase
VTATGAPSAPSAQRRTFGILGGTFDPIHDGHLALAREALDVLDLEHVLFVPNADPPHKPAGAVTAAVHREAMVGLAIEPERAFVLSRIELERPGPSYAIETVTALADRARGEGRPEPWFVLSAEVLDDFATWREPERILDTVRLAVAPRPGADPLDERWVAATYPGREERFAFLPGPMLDIASTTVRARVAAGEPIDDLVPPVVARYIAEHGLYEGDGGGTPREPVLDPGAHDGGR